MSSRFFLTDDDRYFETTSEVDTPDGSIAVSQRPSPDHAYNRSSGQWEAQNTPADASSVVLSKLSFILTAMREGWLTEPEALAWAENGTLPTWLSTYLATLPGSSGTTARIQIATATSIARNSAVLSLVQAAKLSVAVTITDAEIDTAFLNPVQA